MTTLTEHLRTLTLPPGLTECEVYLRSMEAGFSYKEIYATLGRMMENDDIRECGQTLRYRVVPIGDKAVELFTNKGYTHAIRELRRGGDSLSKAREKLQALLLKEGVNQ